MTLDIYFREDIANILRSVNLAGGCALDRASIEFGVQHKDAPENAAEIIEHLALYREGYEVALYAVAAAFGIAPGFEL